MAMDISLQVADAVSYMYSYNPIIIHQVKATERFGKLYILW